MFTRKLKLVVSVARVGGTLCQNTRMTKWLARVSLFWRRWSRASHAPLTAHLSLPLSYLHQTDSLLEECFGIVDFLSAQRFDLI
jgi:hypothetical protein